MNQLKDYLGTWEYTHVTEQLPRFYQIIPLSSGKYSIKWGRKSSLDGYPVNGEKVVEAREALRRGESKRKGGYKLVETYSFLLDESANISLNDIFPKQEKKAHPIWTWLSK